RSSGRKTRKALLSSELQTHPTPRHCSRRAKAILKVFHVKKVIGASKERRADFFGEPAFIAAKKVDFRIPGKSQFGSSKRKIVFEDRRQVSAGVIQVEANEKGPVVLVQV